MRQPRGVCKLACAFANLSCCHVQKASMHEKPETLNTLPDCRSYGPVSLLPMLDPSVIGDFVSIKPFARPPDTPN